MRRVLITGMSGTGKSTVIQALRECGCDAIDLDEGYVVQQDDGTQLWNELLVGWLLDADRGEVLFVAGCEENMIDFLPRFDSVILLSAPTEVILDRLERRINNDFGKSEEQRAKILWDIENVMPLLRRIADHELVTTSPVDEIVEAILWLSDGPVA
jgi:dephospho-CoA kinase